MAVLIQAFIKHIILSMVTMRCKAVYQENRHDLSEFRYHWREFNIVKTLHLTYNSPSVYTHKLRAEKHIFALSIFVSETNFVLIAIQPFALTRQTFKI